MSDHPERARPPPRWTAFCPKCHTSFADIWAYKRHQDACIASTDSEDSEEDEDE